jgi:OOP family OmpA-OmpF porin
MRTPFLPRLIALGSLSVALVSPAVFAAEDPGGLYVGGSFGLSWSHLTGNNIYSSKGSSDRKDLTSGKLYGGYRFNEYLAVELQSASLGTSDSTYSNNLGNLVNNRHTRTSSSALALSVLGILPVSENFSLLGKLGVAQTTVKYTESDDLDKSAMRSGKQKSNNVLLGVGAEYKLTKQISLRAEYENLGTVKFAGGDRKLRNDMLSLGVRYAF